MKFDNYFQGDTVIVHRKHRNLIRAFRGHIIDVIDSFSKRGDKHFKKIIIYDIKYKKELNFYSFEEGNIQFVNHIRLLLIEKIQNHV